MKKGEEGIRRYLATVPGRFEFVFTPEHSSWLNLVEEIDPSEEYNEADIEKRRFKIAEK